MTIYERVGTLLPKGFVEWVKRELTYVGIEIGDKRFAGFLLLFSIGLSFAIALNLFVFLKVPFAPSLILVFFLFAGSVIFWLNSISTSKGRFVESVLPDALQLIASNIRAGMTTERALFAAARPEFGVLAEELRVASRKIFSGERSTSVLKDIPNKIKSDVLKRTMDLLVEGIKSGGQMSDLLLQLSDDIREENNLRAEINANVSIYVAMIFITAAFGAPLLFGISSVIVGIIGEQLSTLNIPEQALGSQTIGSGVFRFFSGEKATVVTDEFVLVFMSIALFMTCVFAALTLGVIKTGHEKDGVKMIPIILIIAFTLFYLIRIMLSQFVSGIGVI